MNRKGLGRPVVFSPKQLAIRRLTRYGHSFIALEYDPLTSGGKEPTIHHGTPLPEQVLVERTNHREAAQEAAGDPKNVLRGASPGANASGYLIDVLASKAEASHSPDVMRFYRSWKRVRRKELILAKSLFTEKRLMKVASGNAVEVLNFKGADFRGNTDVRLEVGSGVTATVDGQTNMLMRLIETGRDFIFPQIANDPQAQNQILQKLGLSAFSTAQKADIDRAEYENAQIATAKDVTELTIMMVEPDPQTGEITVEGEVAIHDPLFKYDNHAIHYEVHRRFIISDKFKDLDDKAQALAIHHADLHKVLADAAQKAAMQQAIAAEQASKVGTSVSVTQPAAGGGNGEGQQAPAINPTSEGDRGTTII